MPDFSTAIDLSVAVGVVGGILATGILVFVGRSIYRMARKGTIEASVQGVPMPDFTAVNLGVAVAVIGALLSTGIIIFTGRSLYRVTRKSTNEASVGGRW